MNYFIVLLKGAIHSMNPRDKPKHHYLFEPDKVLEFICERVTEIERERLNIEFHFKKQELFIILLKVAIHSMISKGKPEFHYSFEPGEVFGLNQLF